ncbi:MAG: DUF3805 domain-containing protein [Leptospiraceae bacterium]|nr:DUF3805 domain-containing protein [Leptospiraceae bacterium]
MHYLDYQQFNSPEGWYVLAFPEYWMVEVIEGIPAFYDPEGGGALVVSAFKNVVGHFDLKLEMKRFLENHKVKYEKDKVAYFRNKQDCEIQACEFISSKRFWLVYMIGFENKLLVCTYNSDEVPDRELSGILTAIISSITFSQQ